MKYAYQSRKYVRLIDWIAANDTVEPNDSLQMISGYRTVSLVADCYDLKLGQVATDVWNRRHPC